MIHVLYCASEGVFQGLFMSMVSVLEKCTDQVSFYVLTGDFSSMDPKWTALTESQAGYLAKLARAYHPADSLTRFDITSIALPALKDNVNAKGHFTPFTFLRLFADRVDSFPDKLLYLDVDTLALRDPCELFGQSLDGKSLGMVKDAVGSHWISPNYCNAGMLLMDLKKIRANKGFEKTLAKTANHPYFMPDQTCLNRVYKGDIKILPSIYNEQKAIQPATVIRHYCRRLVALPYPHLITAKPWDKPEVFYRERGEHQCDEIIAKAKALYAQYEAGDDPKPVTSALLHN